jgi:hypothetical protein
MGAIEVIRTLNDSSVKTRHPLEVVIWTNEEGNHFGLTTLGSGVAAGQLGPEILDRKDDQGLTLADWLRRYGQDPRISPTLASDRKRWRRFSNYTLSRGRTWRKTRSRSA